MTEIYLHFLFSHYGLYANAPVNSGGGAIRSSTEPREPRRGGEDTMDGPQKVRFDSGFELAFSPVEEESEPDGINSR